MRNHRFVIATLLLLALLGVGLVPTSSAQAAGPWVPAADLPAGLGGGDAALLPNGQVFLRSHQTAGRYDPSANRWTVLRTDLNPKQQPALATLKSGVVLVIGGASCGHCGGNQVERYDFRQDGITYAEEMGSSRMRHTATTLADGRVLVTGGAMGPTGPFATTEIYNPATDTWTDSAPMSRGRLNHTATLLDDGRVLVVGDSTAELYNPATNSWSPAATPTAARAWHTASLLADGSVLVLGGNQSNESAPIELGSRTDGPPLASAERYNPATNTWQPVPAMPQPRAAHTATMLSDGQVLVVGGYSTPDPIASALRFDPATQSWHDAGTLAMPQAGHTATRLHDGRVLIAGGSSTELYVDNPAQLCSPADMTICASGRFLAYWQTHSGLAINGYPISNEFTEVLEDGKPYTVQYFERVRMEYHPENAGTPYEVLLGQFGRRLHPADPPAPAAPGTIYFGDTGHNLGGSFRTFWEANGGLVQFGYPLTEEFIETLEDGKPYTVQYFERARFEYHPENPKPYDVLLGQFGRRILNER